MAGTITSLRFQKHNRDRVSVYLDDRFAFGLAAIKAAHLRVGQVLRDDDVVRLREQDDVERSYERALNFLSYRPRSKVEVRRNLHRKNVQGVVIEEVIERLVRAGLVNDEEFARFWVENRSEFRPRGVRALRHELRQKGVPDVIIADALVNVDEEAAARKVAEKGARRFGHLDTGAFRRKFGAYLARRGFSYAIIAPLIKEMLASGCGSAPSNSDGERSDNG